MLETTDVRSSSLLSLLALTLEQISLFFAEYQLANVHTLFWKKRKKERKKLNP